MRPAAHFCDLISGKAEFLPHPPQPRVGEDSDGGGDDDDGRIFPEHPSPIIHAPRDIISRKGKSLTPTTAIGLLKFNFGGVVLSKVIFNGVVLSPVNVTPVPPSPPESNVDEGLRTPRYPSPYSYFNFGQGQGGGNQTHTCSVMINAQVCLN